MSDGHDHFRAGICVHSCDSIQKLEALLGRLSEVCVAAGGGFATRYADRASALADRVSLLERRRESLESLREQSQEGDVSDSLGETIEAVSGQLAAVSDAMAAVRVAEQEAYVGLARIGHLSSSILPEARLRLRRIVEVVRAYNMVALGAANSSHEAPTGLVPRSWLPQGFAWIPLSSIDLSALEAPDLSRRGFRRGYSYDELRDGMRRFRALVLPKLAENDPHLLDRLRADDGPEIAPRDSLAELFSLFFGDRRIRLERYRGQPHYTIVNGRHRIRVALDEGWGAIPAQAVDVERTRSA